MVGIRNTILAIVTLSLISVALPAQAADDVELIFSDVAVTGSECRGLAPIQQECNVSFDATGATSITFSVTGNYVGDVLCHVHGGYNDFVIFRATVIAGVSSISSADDNNTEDPADDTLGEWDIFDGRDVANFLDAGPIFVNCISDVAFQGFTGCSPNSVIFVCGNPTQPQMGLGEYIVTFAVA